MPSEFTVASIELPTPDEVEKSADIIFELGGCRVVGLGQTVVKYGPRVNLKEAESTSFVSRHTSIPVPRILGTYSDDGKNYIFMERIAGKTLNECLFELNDMELQSLASEMKLFMDQLRKLRITDFEERTFIGSLGDGPCMDNIFQTGYESRGPFDTEEDMNENIIQRWEQLWVGKPELNYYGLVLRRMYRENQGHAIRFTHADIAPRNIMVENGRITGIIDWEEAGWYPEYWEYIKAMYAVGGGLATKWPLYIDKYLKPYDYMRLLDMGLRKNLS